MADQPTYFTTGELAEACGATVRTVQYYDGKKLLAPSDYSEGGRRLYTESDAERLRFILMLKDLGLSLAQIRGVLESPRREAILATLLAEQAAAIEDELAALEDRLSAVNAFRADLELFGKIMTADTHAMTIRMNDERARRKWWAVMVAVGVLMDAAWIGAVVFGVVTGTWWPLPCALVAAGAAGCWMVAHYSSHATYLCPACGAEFRPKLGAFFFSGHTPRTRKLTCPCCHEKDWCVERYHAAPLDLAPGQCVPGEGGAR